MGHVEPERSVIEDNEVMLLHIEKLESCVQLHFEPRKWSASWKRYYEGYLNDLEKRLYAEGVRVIIEGMNKDNEKGIRLIESFGFNKVDTGDHVVLWKTLGDEDE